MSPKRAARDGTEDDGFDPLKEEFRALEKSNGHGELPAVTSLDDILGVDDLPTEWVNAPEWGKRCLMQGMSMEQRDALEKRSVETDGETTTFKREGFRAAVVALCWVHPETRQRLVVGDAAIGRLSQKSNVVLDRLCEVGSRLSGFGGKKETTDRKNDSRAGGSSPSSSVTNSVG